MPDSRPDVLFVSIHMQHQQTEQGCRMINYLKLVATSQSKTGITMGAVHRRAVRTNLTLPAADLHWIRKSSQLKKVMEMVVTAMH
jgi:hypothetical protein